MTTATQPRHIVESFVGSRPGATAKDDAGNDCIVIDDVLILSRESTNGRRYTDACLQDAYDRQLYEGVEIGNGHQRDEAALAGLPRDNDEILGFFKNVRLVEGKLRGQAWFTVRDRLTESVKRASVHNPRLYKFSHDAIWDERSTDPDGTHVIHKIERVNSVDLVRKGATTKSLYESEQTMSKAKEQATEPVKRTLESIVTRKRDRRICEEAGMDMTTPVDVPADANPEEAMKTAFMTAIQAAISSGDKESALKAVKAYFKITDDGAEAPAEPTGGTEGVKPLGVDGGMRLLESHKVPITSARVNALSRLTESEASAYLSDLSTLTKERDEALAKVGKLTDETPTSLPRITEAEKPKTTTGNEEAAKARPWSAYYPAASAN